MCKIVENIQGLIAEINTFLNKEKSMIADLFVKFVHRVQDIIGLNNLASEEERKSEVDMDWIWKDVNPEVEI